ncbi:MAG: glycosyltransferase family A protein, partial [Phycisphaerales bacterium]
MIRVHNAERYLDASVRSVLEQIPSPRQVVIVDDGSTDDSSAIAD